MEWIKCSERMPEIVAGRWRTPLPVLVNCDLGVIPAYYAFQYNGDEKVYGFMVSLIFGNDLGDMPEEDMAGLMARVTEWMPTPSPPTE
ncbi:DUF551 domain-containing protein [Pluralibacter gergoviae]|uniref:DUF551 domain-containing protein n=1 Tax=Pluralibacter gergoviae TaxID=61647 RepID=UPI00069FB848|nr:DUF551 domain-containing protein [Pluralibacter gergoviae]